MCKINLNITKFQFHACGKIIIKRYIWSSCGGDE